MKRQKTAALLLCAVLLAGCTAPAAQSGASPPVQNSAPAPSSASAAQSAAAPSGQAEQPLVYEPLPLSREKKTPPAFEQATAQFDREQTEKQNAYKLALGLYNNDKQAVAEACFGENASAETDYAYDMGLAFPFNDLDGLVVTDFYLGGGKYESPFIALTVADPGATGLLRGAHSYYVGFADGGDSAQPKGVVNWLSPWAPPDVRPPAALAVWAFRDHGGPPGPFASTEELRAASGTNGYLMYMLYGGTGRTDFTAGELRAAAVEYLALEDYDPGPGPFALPPGGAEMGPSYGWMFLGGLAETDEAGADAEYLNAVIGRQTDGLGLGIDCALAYRLRGAQGEGYQVLSCAQWTLPSSPGEGWAETVPGGNFLNEADTETLCANINAQLAGYLDGRYPDYETVFGAWDPMLPVPRAVTPAALRTETVTWGGDARKHLRAWVPLPEGHWAVFECWLDELELGNYSVFFRAVPQKTP